MVVNIQEISIIGILSTMSATGIARSCIDQIWSTHLFGNINRAGSDYLPRCIQRTGGGIPRYEIGPDKFPVVGVSSANRLLCSVVENASPRSTVVLIIGLSDLTQPTIFSGDKIAWLVYVTISKILSRTRKTTVKRLIRPRTLLPVPLKFIGESARADEAQREMNADVLRTVFDLVLALLNQVVQEGTVMDCADSKICFFFPSGQPGLRIMLNMRPWTE